MGFNSGFKGLNDDLCTFVTISQSFVLSMRNVSEKFAEKIKVHIFCLITFIIKIVPFMRQCGKNTVQPDRSQVTI